MKPLSSRPPPHTTHTRRRTACVANTAGGSSYNTGGSGSGGGGGGSSGSGGGERSGKDSGAGVTVSGSGARDVIIDRSSFPQWMKTLEDRWQKLHSKINCPPAHGSGGRFNWVARRLLSQRLSRIAKTKGSNTSSYDNNNHINNNNNRCNSTAPNTTTYKQSLGSEEGERDLCYDVNDSCVFGDGDRPARPVTALNADVGEFASASDFFNLGSRPSSADCSRPLSQSAFRSHPSMRDGALEGNNNSEAGLAPAPDLARTDNSSGQNGGAKTNNNPRLHSATLDRTNHSTGGGCADADGVGGGDCGSGGSRETEGGEGRSGAWGDHSEMNGPSYRGVRTLNPLTGGHLVRTAKTGVSQISHITTKSCPAALNVQASASTSGKDQWGRSRPVGWGRTGGSRRQNGDRDGMRVFAHMSVEARHAITETLREMGVGNNDNDRNDDGGDEDSEEDNADESDVSLPSLPDQHRRDDCDYAIQPGQSIVSRGDATTINSNNNNRRGVRQGDATSSVNATVRGGRSPRRSKAKKFSSHHTNGRARPKSCKTIAAEQDEARTNAAVNGEDLDLLSMASLGSASSGPSSPTGIRRGVTSDHTRLPAITSRTEPHVLPLRADTLRHVNYRIQGVGSYRVAREATFEITAPDFDIRYRDVITCQKGDRDTPPPDIFDRSVSKVKEWLTKYYTPR